MNSYMFMKEQQSLEVLLSTSLEKAEGKKFILVLPTGTMRVLRKDHIACEGKGIELTALRHNAQTLVFVSTLMQIGVCVCMYVCI